MKLIIAEKPSVAAAYAAALGAKNQKDGYLEGNGYLVTWCIGHLVSLAEAVPANWWFAPSSSLTSWPSRTPSRWLSAIWWILPPPWSMLPATMWYPSSCPGMWTARTGCKRSCTARRKCEYLKKAAADASRPPLSFWGRERHGDVWFIHGTPLRSTARPSRRWQTRFSLSLPSPGLFGDLIICLTYK